MTKSEDRIRRKSTNIIASGQRVVPIQVSSIPREQALHIIDELRARNNAELLSILEEEQRNETGRESKLREVNDDNERKRLEKIFGIERARASERIVNASTEHEVQIRSEMRRLGLA